MKTNKAQDVAQASRPGAVSMSADEAARFDQRIASNTQSRQLDIKTKLTTSLECVKSVDLHNSEPWVLAALYSGYVMIWDYESGSLTKSFEVSDSPVRCAKFIERKQWLVAVSDDKQIRVFNYNTMEKVKDFEGHADIVRCLEVHPTLPYILSSSDDNTIKMWDWDCGFDCTQNFEGHTHYVTQVKLNPKDTSTFASASLDRTIKIWGLASHVPQYTLQGHEGGVTCVDYYPSGDKPYILSGADDRTVKVWDYQTKSIVHSVEGHSDNVCAVMFHPKLPIIASASEDGTVRIWQRITYRAEETLNYGMERAWALAASPDSNKFAIGFDKGCVCIELGSKERDGKHAPATHARAEAQASRPGAVSVPAMTKTVNSPTDLIDLSTVINPTQDGAETSPAGVSKKSLFTTPSSVAPSSAAKPAHQASTPIHQASTPIHQASTPIYQASTPIHQASTPTLSSVSSASTNNSIAKSSTAESISSMISFDSMEYSSSMGGWQLQWVDQSLLPNYKNIFHLKCFIPNGYLCIGRLSVVVMHFVRRSTRRNSGLFASFGFDRRCCFLYIRVICPVWVLITAFVFSISGLFAPFGF